MGNVLNDNKQHAMLSPSGASRWLTCTPSALMESKYPRTSNSAADEGTYAHAMCELFLRRANKELTDEQFDNAYNALLSNPFYSIVLEDHCTDFMEFVLYSANRGPYSTEAPKLLKLESVVDLSYYIPNGKGTTDVTIICEDEIHIIDFKYGRGTYVEAAENKQMALYALGAIKEYELSYDFKTVRTTVYQPRMNNFGSHTQTVKELLNWAETYLRPRALLASTGAGAFQPGPNCKWCKAKGECKALAVRNLELAKHDFEEPSKLTNDDIAAILEIEEDLTSWLKAVKAHALSLLKVSSVIPGYKLVEARTNRKISDLEALKENLFKYKIPIDRFMKPQVMMGLGDLEQSLGKILFKKTVEPLLEKAPGELTVVSDLDRRAPVVLSSKKILNALDAFSDVPL